MRFFYYLIEVPTKRNFVQLFIDCKDRLKSQCNVLGRISLTLFLLEIFNLIRYANYTIYDNLNVIDIFRTKVQTLSD